jgi:RND family efflux transporter MFP subunit
MLSAAAGLCLCLVGCDRQVAPAAAMSPGAMPPPEVRVSLPVVREVTDYEDFTGRTDAKLTVEVRARVTGYLSKINFKDGCEVKEGDVLFEIDPGPYQADFDRALANLVLAEAHQKRLDSDYQRATSLLPRNAISREEFDKIAGDRAEAAASTGVAKAARDLAELNLKYTRVIAPIAGRISRRMMDPGNMVKADETTLTTIVSQDPMYAYFDVDERTLLRTHHIGVGGKVLMGLSCEDCFPHEGTIDFVDNRVDSSTGTLRVRGVFANPKRELSPGLFVRIRMPLGKPYKPMLVAEQAIATDQGQKFVYVVGSDNKVSYRPVQIGRLHEGLRVITGGIGAKDRVIVSGVQRVRPNIEVKPQLEEMPASVGAAASKPPEAAKSNKTAANR